MYFCMGWFLFSPAGVGLAAAIVFWLLCLFYFIVFAVTRASPCPLRQPEGPPHFETTVETFYEENDNRVQRSPGEN
jgi:Na+-driven multidrug efflux pump